MEILEPKFKVETAIEELIIEKGDAAESIDGDGTQRQRERKNQDRENAEDIRRQALERMGQTQKRKSVDGENEAKEKKGSSRSDTLLHLRERNEFLHETHKEELGFRKQELMLQEKKAGRFYEVDSVTTTTAE